MSNCWCCYCCLCCYKVEKTKRSLGIGGQCGPEADESTLTRCPYCQVIFHESDHGNRVERDNLLDGHMQKWHSDKPSFQVYRKEKENKFAAEQKEEAELLAQQRAKFAAEHGGTKVVPAGGGGALAFSLVKLKVLTGPHANTLSFRYKLSAKKKSVIIGRDPDLDVDGLQEVLLLDRDDDASSEHGLITLKGGVFWYEDLDSTNGSKVDGKAAAPGVPVKLTDSIEIEISCNTTILFQFPNSVSTDSGSPSTVEMIR